MADISEYVKRVKELNPTIKVRAAVVNDGERFVTLFNTYYKRKTSIEYFQWQFFNSPFDSILYMAFDKDQLIGYYGLKCYPLTSGVHNGFAIDFLTHEPYRKRGIAFLLEAEILNFCRIKKIDVLTALPNTYGNAAFKVMGWKSIAKIDKLVLEDIGSFTAQPYRSIDYLSQQNLLVGFLKDDTFRKWRFGNNPIYQYENITFNKHCFAIIKIFTDPVTGIPYGDIVDITYNDDLQNLTLLMEKIFEEFKQKAVQILTTWALPHTLLHKFLILSGFKIEIQARYFCVNVLNPDKENLCKIEKWNLVQADSEIF